MSDFVDRIAQAADAYALKCEHADEYIQESFTAGAHFAFSMPEVLALREALEFNMHEWTVITDGYKHFTGWQKCRDALAVLAATRERAKP